MIQTKVLIELLKSIVWKDNNKIKSVGESIALNEERKGHQKIAKDIRYYIDKLTTTYMQLQELPTNIKNLIMMENFETTFDDIILSECNTKIIQNFINEYRNKDKLKEYGLSNKSKLLLVGESGCGKTMTAKALSNAIELPLLYVDLANVITSYLGNTSKNIAELFKQASISPCILFFDEIDALARMRTSDAQDVQEMNRVVNTMLQKLDYWNSDSIFIGATNLDSTIDFAIKRRFDDILIYEKPNKDNINSFIKKLEKKYGLSFNDFEWLEYDTEMFKNMNYYDIEKIVLDNFKNQILNKTTIWW